jgi:signal transduction histidine kinase
MMHHFLANNRDELIERCKLKVAHRPKRAATEDQLKNGVPIFLEQLQRTLEAEESNDSGVSLKISGASGGDSAALSEMGVSAAAHGKHLLELGFTVDQVVHDYGDLCQAITDLAFERDAPFGIDEFRTLNRCLDNAIADAVTEFSFQRDASIARQQDADLVERVGGLVLALRNSLSRATLAVGALELGNLPMAGATGAVLKRSLAGLKTLIDSSIADLGAKSGSMERREVFSLAFFIADAMSAATLYAKASGCTLRAAPIDPLLAVSANRERMLGALANLLQNAFKFTLPDTEIALNAYAFGRHILIDVKDHCGGLPHGDVERMFSPLTQRSTDRSGLGLGLSTSRQGIEADGGTLGVKDLPGTGCLFTISLPRATVGKPGL